MRFWTTDRFYNDFFNRLSPSAIWVKRPGSTAASVYVVAMGRCAVLLRSSRHLAAASMQPNSPTWSVAPKATTNAARREGEKVQGPSSSLEPVSPLEDQVERDGD